MDIFDYFKFLLALIFVLGLIGLAAVLLRYFGIGGAMRLGRRMRGEARRLEIIEVAAVDARRRLLLVRRDDREHLLLLGANSDLVIESGIPASDITAPVSRPEGGNHDGHLKGKSGFGQIIATIRGDARG